MTQEQEQKRTLWQRIINSRFLAGVGVVALFLVGGATISSFAEAQSPVYTTTSVVVTNEINSLQQQINSLHNRVSTLETQMRGLQYTAPRPSTVTTRATTVTPTYPIIQPVTTNTTYYGNYNPPIVARPVVIDQNGGTYVAGYDIYFTGRGFTPNETIFITRNGSLVGQATADAGGNFAASGVFLPLGSSTFSFTGQTSSVTAVASVQGSTTVVP